MSGVTDYLFSILNQQMSQHMETGKYDLRRPDYVLDTEATIKNAIGMSVWRGGGRFLEPPVPGLEAYSVFAQNKPLLLPGDVLIPNGQSADVPIVTVINNRRKIDCVAIRTNRIGTLLTTRTNALHVNVRFDWYRPAGPEPGIVPDITGSPEQEQRYAALVTRADITSGYRLLDDVGQRWMIVQVNGTGSLMTLILRKDTNS